MRIVLAAYGTSGDVNPMLGVAVTLQDRGHDVSFVTTPNFEAKLRRLGLPHRLTPPAIDLDVHAREELAADPRFFERGIPTMVKVLDKVYVPLIRPMVEAVRAELEAAPTDLLVNHPMTFGGQLAAAVTNTPFARVSYSPYSLASAADPAQPGPRMPPRWLLGLAMKGPVRWLFNRTIGRRVDAVARELGLPSTTTWMFDAQRDAVLELCLWSALFRGPASDDLPNVRFCGFPLPGAGQDVALADEVEAFLDAGEPPIVLGLGSLLPPFFPDVYRTVAAVCRELGQRALLVGCKPALVGGASDAVLCVDYAPYAALFKRARVVIHHGGIGSLTEAFHAGRPQVIVPFATDQFDNASRAVALGVARSLPHRHFNASKLKTALGACVRQAAIAERAAEVGQQIRAETSGTEMAAKLIEQWRSVAG